VNFNTYRYFNEVAQTKSIRRAADRLHVAPSAISRQLAILEQSLGALLLDRTNNGVQLTAAGVMLERFTRNMFRDLDRVHESIKNLRTLNQGEVKVWGVGGLVRDFLPTTIAEFNDRYPAIKYSIFIASSDRIIEALIRDEADIGIVFNAGRRPNIEIVAEHSEPVRCLVSRSHPFAERQSITVEELCREQVAMQFPDSGIRQAFDQAVARQRLSPNVVVSTNSLELMRTMAVTGQVVTISPVLAAGAELLSGSLRAIPIEDDALASITFAVCVHRDRQLSHAGYEFLKSISKRFQEIV
jgi:DNA-binding transcriptional LysR family regulator